MAVGDDHPDEEAPLESREPSLEDLVELCHHLNDQGAEYLRVAESGSRHYAAHRSTSATSSRCGVRGSMSKPWRDWRRRPPSCSTLRSRARVSAEQLT